MWRIGGGVIATSALFAFLNLVAALGCGLIAGVFYAFSSFVMRALGRLPATGGVGAMQSINVVVLNPVFLGTFVGTALVCGLAMIAALLRWHDQQSVYMLVGGVLYLGGTFLVTIAFNVPWNNALEAVTAEDPGGANVWAKYRVQSTAWNHIAPQRHLRRRYPSCSPSVREGRPSEVTKWTMLATIVDPSTYRSTYM
jgi:uncharacterized membrane protein